MRVIPTLDNPGFGTTIGDIQVLLADDISDNVAPPTNLDYRYFQPDGVSLYYNPDTTSVYIQPTILDTPNLDDHYFRPDGVSRYYRPDTTSVYIKP